ncbi:MAG: glycosyltransferase family 117 protein [Bacteroidota bacterium]
MKQYNLVNISLGWLSFLVAAITYILTVEPTLSLWDCGEFIATAFKLEVGHPPGAPMYMILGRFFSLFAPDVTRGALSINIMSALASAFTIMFLFWTITHLARKLVAGGDKEISTGQVIAIMGAGLTGALAYAFSDTFWFSAVEGEVYGTSSLMTALVFWAILKWENVADEPYANRWLILIAYVIGLSVGVHLLNLLAIPAIVFVYYFRKYEFSWKGFTYAIILSIAIIAIIMWGLLTGFIILASRFELFLVNTIGLPYNSGLYLLLILFALSIILALRSSHEGANKQQIVVFGIATVLFSGMWLMTDSTFLNILVLAVLAFLVWRLTEKRVPVLNTALTVALVVMIGYSSFATIYIRSNANPPMDENNPENVFSFLYYLNREQYGARPLVKGPYFNAPVVSYERGKPTYNPIDGEYKITNRELVPEYDERFVTLFPRMWSPQSGHVEVYKQWNDFSGKPVQITDNSGERKIVRKPTFAENLGFMFTYQMGHMYFRYFMWNFAGRQNDTQGYGGPFNGNWISGIKALDESRLGPQDNMPDHMKNHPSRNKYYLLPLLLGLAGFYYQLNKNKKDFWVVLLLFVMTGIAIVIYLNQYPNQPRERDYAYAGSFYAFSVWIGLGVLFIYDLFRKIAGKKLSAIIAGVLSLVAVPVLMASQNWDDHDRSGRYTATAVAKNYLRTVAPNAILFTNGDNDTFPLWYAQEVEGVRTDVRVCNLMLFNTDWYIDQMKMKTYESEPMELTMPKSKYYDGVNSQLFIVENPRLTGFVEIDKVVEFIRSDNQGTKYRFPDGEEHDYLPTRKIRIPVDREKVLASGTVKPEDADLIVPYIDITLEGNYILKSQMMMLDFLAQNDWERPVYFVTGYHDDALGMEEYFQLEGSAYRLVPIKSQNYSWLDYGRIDTDILYDNLMNKFTWGNTNDPDVYLDHYHRHTLLVVRARLNYAKLAKALVLEGDNERAVKALDHIMEKLPLYNLPWDNYMPDIIDSYLIAGDQETALDLIARMKDHYSATLDYYTSLPPYYMKNAEMEIQMSLGFLQRVASSCRRNGLEEKAKEIDAMLQEYMANYYGNVQG